jgi:hypothetical protein
MREKEIGELITRELRPVSAPPGLWRQVEDALDVPAARPWGFQPVLALAAALSLLICVTPLLRGKRELDLGSYLAPVQAASLVTSASAIAQAPPHFQNVSATGAASPAAGYQVAGYRVSAERVASVGGETVRQVVLTAAGSAVALFISSPKVRLDAGPNRWVDTNVEGVACKRLNCPRVRTAQFSCFEQTCVLICKACSDRAMSALMSGVGEFR